MPADSAKVIAMLKRIHLFRGLDDQKLQLVADALETVEHPTGHVIYREGDDSEHFYFVLSGRVRMTQYDARSQLFYTFGMLEDDDVFGHEVLESNWPRQVAVEAVTDVTLLRLDVPNFVNIINQLPSITNRLHLILNSYRLMLSKHFSWKDTDEMIQLVTRRSVYTLLRMILPPTVFGFLVIPLFLYLYLIANLAMTMLLLLGLAIMATVGWWVWSYVDWSNDYYIVTSQRTVHLEKVVLLYDSRQESPNESLQSTSTNTTQLGRILGYGNVAIRTFIGNILFGQVDKPDQVMAVIQEMQARAQSSQRRAELKAMEISIERKIGLAPMPPPLAKPAAPPQITPWQRLISDMFHLRYEIGGTILFRTHWFILLQKIFIPSLMLIGLVFLFLLRASNQFTALSLQATCGLTGVIGLVAIVWWLYQYSDWHNDIYLITPDQVVDVNKKPLGRESRQSAPIKNIISIEYKRLGIIGLVLNYGTVFIRIGDQQLTFDDVYNPAEVQRELFHRLAAKSHAEKQAQAEGERQRLAEWIAAYHRVTQRSQPPRTPPARGGF